MIDAAKILMSGTEPVEKASNQEPEDESDKQSSINYDDYIKKTDLESCRSICREYCPVTPDYNPGDYVKNPK